MIDKEIETLKNYLINGEIEIKSEEEGIDAKVEEETEAFFSQYPPGEVDASLKTEYKNSLKNIYINKINKKRTIISDLNSRIMSFENDFINAST